MTTLRVWNSCRSIVSPSSETPLRRGFLFLASGISDAASRGFLIRFDSGNRHRTRRQQRPSRQGSPPAGPRRDSGVAGSQGYVAAQVDAGPVPVTMRSTTTGRGMPMAFSDDRAPSGNMTVSRRTDRASTELVGICRGLLADGGFTPVFTDTYEKADRGLRSVHVEAKEVQRRVQARCY